MKYKQKIPLSILADIEVFNFLKEKVGERKTKVEAYCDLLDKSLAGFVSPFLRKQEYALQPNQCHVTVSDLAMEWHWHRATVRSFLDAIETFGLLKRIRLPKSIVITMVMQPGQSTEEHNVQEQPDFATRFRDILSDWITGKTTTAEIGMKYGQLAHQAMTEIANNENRCCPDNRFDVSAKHTGNQGSNIRETALACIAHAALCKVLRKSRFDDGSPLVDFFRHDLGGEWSDFIEASKDLAELILGPGTSGMTIDTVEDKEQLQSLCKSFLSLAARAQETTD